MRIRGEARPDDGVVAGVAQFRGYQRGCFRADALAGVTVTAYLVPQCLAYSGLAGAPPVTGLWVAVIAMVLYAFLGTSRQLSVGPESAVAIMVAAAVAPLAAGDPARYLALSAGLAIMVGVLCIWVLADLLSHPILIGYMAGVALIMIGSQLGTITGISLTGHTTPDKVAELVGRLREIRPVTLVLGTLVVVFLVALHLSLIHISEPT